MDWYNDEEFCASFRDAFAKILNEFPLLADGRPDYKNFTVADFKAMDTCLDELESLFSREGFRMMAFTGLTYFLSHFETTIRFEDPHRN